MCVSSAYRDNHHHHYHHPRPHHLRHHCFIIILALIDIFTIISIIVAIIVTIVIYIKRRVLKHISQLPVLFQAFAALSVLSQAESPWYIIVYLFSLLNVPSMIIILLKIYSICLEITYSKKNACIYEYC